MKKIQIFDSTLRDGAQARGINYSVRDKINVLRLLDNLGVDYIEAGNPASNPKEREFFSKVSDVVNIPFKEKLTFTPFLSI